MHAMPTEAEVGYSFNFISHIISLLAQQNSDLNIIALTALLL